MKKTTLMLSAIALTISSSIQAHEATLENVARDFADQPTKETDWYMSRLQKEIPVNTFKHNRIPSNKDHQFVIRENEDTMYSHAILDVTKSATISMPKYDEYAIVQVIDENHYTIAEVYPGQTLNLTPDMLSSGTHVFLNTRVAASNSQDLKALKKANEYQDSIKISSVTSNPYISKGFSEKQVLAARAKVQKLRPKIPMPFDMFGNKGTVDLTSFVIASSAGWAGLPSDAAVYLPQIPGNTGSTECSSLTINPPPLQYKRHAFFSMTVYDKDGWIADDDFAISNKRMTPNQDGTYTFRFNCKGQPNNLDVQKGWSGLLRMYLPDSKQAIQNYVLNDYLKNARLVKGPSIK
ncbi:TPA: DUF1254 domain-containing protein [Vibrio parahaemolyticus]|uniref:DUF1254 domain-containing protein n=1 Tax=Vibrio parahaemolyticus TaxID=670 RepID=UPI001122D810|nr:DUF1254 domain-containing protein [Vibrio parahaemolyticus]EGR0934086.1 DUF1254 domain-containing protein [Vibrio parahaemolyticus]EJG1897105.1 DUF1254 domain-containing protein [Vibrio parahaemolyticus]MDF4358240.1 DUF1254 domain-containing protein [Vibrio parahaemolyticus]MDF4541588.1 DUF1254 domain-containing protein [Vibrio parahaemolyticus]MDF4609927.1 DUF1254 domain-containing protein [Vibrio parahaemolyticus]